MQNLKKKIKDYDILAYELIDQYHEDITGALSKAKMIYDLNRRQTRKLFNRLKDLLYDDYEIDFPDWDF